MFKFEGGHQKEASQLEAGTAPDPAPKERLSIPEVRTRESATPAKGNQQRDCLIHRTSVAP